MKLPPPQQLSSVPGIDQQALGWAGLLVDGLQQIRISELAYGSSTATWPGAQTFSTALQVTNGLSKRALAIFTQPITIPAGSNGPPTSAITNPGASPQQFQIQWFTIDGVNPVNGSTVNFYWLAVN